MTVVDLVARNARMYPDGVAFVEVRPVSKARAEITWSAFNERMNRIGHALAAEGIEKGMRVALLGRNSINWLRLSSVSWQRGHGSCLSIFALPTRI